MTKRISGGEFDRRLCSRDRWSRPAWHDESEGNRVVD